MKYYVCSPYGRTGSRRISSMLNETLNGEIYPRVACYIKSTPQTTIEEKLEIWFQTEDTFNKQKINFNEVSEILKNLKDNTVIHSHKIVTLSDIENWTAIHSIRQSKAEQIMSNIIATHINSYSPVSADKKFAPIVVSKEAVDSALYFITNHEKKIKESYPNRIEIFMEDSIQTIEEKLMIKFNEKAKEKHETKYISNHTYKQLTLNYKEVFEWCGETTEENKWRIQ